MMSERTLWVVMKKILQFGARGQRSFSPFARASGSMRHAQPIRITI